MIHGKHVSKRDDDLFFQELLKSCHGSFSSDVGMVLAFFRSLNCTAAGKKCNYLLFFLCLFFKNNYLEVFTTIDFQEKTMF